MRPVIGLCDTIETFMSRRPCKYLRNRLMDVAALYWKSSASMIAQGSCMVKNHVQKSQ